MDKYAKQIEESNISTLRSLLNKMPPFCKDFFRGIANSTESRTQVAYCRDIYHFLHFVTTHNPIYADTPIKKIPFHILEALTTSDIDEYLEYLTLYTVDGVKYQNDNASKSRKLSSLSALYTFYIKRGQLNNNPLAAVERPKKNDKTITTLNQEEISSLVKVTESPIKVSKRQQMLHEKIGVRDLAIITMLLGTGIRVSELVGLDLNDIDFKQRSLKILRKGGKEAYVYFGDAVLSTLTHYLALDEHTFEQGFPGDEDKEPSPRDKLLKENKDEPALFISLKGTRLTDRSVQDLVKKYSSMLETNKKITPHKLRSTFGTQIYNKTGDIYLTAELLGHQDINTTKKHYASMDNEKLKKAADIIKLD